MIKQIKKLEPIIEKLLEAYPKYRDNQNAMFVAVCVRYDEELDFSNFTKKFTRGELPPFESVSRARRKVQARREDLRGKNYKGRQKACEEVKEGINK